MSSDPLKICPKCQQQDRTGFSTCRYCGTRYSAAADYQSNSISHITSFAIIALIVIIGAVIYSQHLPYLASSYRSLTGQHSIKSAGKPTVIELYIPIRGGCPHACMEAAKFDAVFQRCEAEYAKEIRFEIIDMEDQNNWQRAAKLEGNTFMALPALYLFDRNGNRVDKLDGFDITYPELDKRLRDLIRPDW